MSTYRRSWIFTKNSWRVFKLDKELITYPLISTIASIVMLGVFFAVGYFSQSINLINDTNSKTDSIPELLFGLCFVIVSMIINNYFTGALIAAALKRFDGEDPTVAYGFKEANKRFSSILAYSAFNGSIGYILQLIQERLPFGGKVLAWLAGTAWNIANVFSLPVIMTSTEYTGPITAVKQSVGILKRTWRETAVANFGLGIIGLLVVVAYVVPASALVSYSLNFEMIPLTIGLSIAALIGLFGVVAVLTALTGIVKAAIYYYAITGKAPEQFDKELMEAAFTTKAARKIFA